MADFRQDFFRFAAAHRALLFGEFVTKAGRTSPYFFNAGMFSTGAALAELSEFYAKAIRAAGIEFDVLFGSAYKGIPLAAGVAMTLARAGHDVPFSFNRKEAKDHGEGGVVVGAPLKGRVLIIDDVISAGTSVRESVAIIRAQNAEPCGVAIAVDRMERGTTDVSAVQEVERDYGLPVIAIATLDDLIGFVHSHERYSVHLDAVLAYRQRYGIGRDAS
ncbi:MAG: orotate phosphoribosyltransferase [Betaproteobacteria bacterium]|nr:MAG: orotate phosphoribosyltransferase [Betaproteobacteria bacterium]